MRGTAQFLLVTCSPVVHGWATRSQTHFGAQIADLQAQMRGEAVNRDNQAQLGYLWHLPEDPNDKRGLGGGITWAWDSKLCELIDPAMTEDIFGSNNIINCGDYRAAVARAFDKWAANSRFIKFLDVTEECEALGLNYGPPTGDTQEGMPHGGCPLAEIWITKHTGRRRSRILMDDNVTLSTVSTIGDNQEEGGTAVATALSHARYAGVSGVSSFRYTNGMYADRPVVETYAGTFSFNTDTICWYMDSEFCSGFHDLKRDLGGADNARMFVYGWTYGIMSIGLVFFLCLFGQLAMRVSVDAELEDDEDGDGQLSCKERFNAGVRVLSHWNPITLTIFVACLMVPPLMANKIFAPCFDCFDYEAAALHEIGHFLGLGHLNNIPENWLAPASDGGYGDVAFAGPTPGVNSYHAGLAAAYMEGRRPTTSDFNCSFPWEQVMPGIPAGAEVDGDCCPYGYDYRISQMEAQTQFNPLACLMPDDLEALMVLYPECDTDLAIFEGVCHSISLNIGYVRVFAYVMFPTILALLCVVGLAGLVHWFERREKARLNVDDTKTNSNSAKAAINFAAMKHKKTYDKNFTDFTFEAAGSLGLSITPLKSTNTGGKIKAVDPGSIAFSKGVKPGGLIMQVNGEKVEDGHGISQIGKAGRPLTLTIMYEVKKPPSALQYASSAASSAASSGASLAGKGASIAAKSVNVQLESVKTSTNVN